MRTKQNEPVLLDDLASSNLPEKINLAIDKTEFTVDVSQWTPDKASIHVNATKDGLSLEVQTRIPIKKVLAIIVGITSLALAALSLTIQCWPTLQSFFHGGSPVP